MAARLVLFTAAVLCMLAGGEAYECSEKNGAAAACCEMVDTRPTTPDGKPNPTLGGLQCYYDGAMCKEWPQDKEQAKAVQNKCPPDVKITPQPWGGCAKFAIEADCCKGAGHGAIARIQNAASGASKALFDKFQKAAAKLKKKPDQAKFLAEDYTRSCYWTGTACTFINPGTYDASKDKCNKQTYGVVCGTVTGGCTACLAAKSRKSAKSGKLKTCRWDVGMKNLNNGETGRCVAKAVMKCKKCMAGEPARCEGSPAPPAVKSLTLDCTKSVGGTCTAVAAADKEKCEAVKGEALKTATACEAVMTDAKVKACTFSPPVAVGAPFACGAAQKAAQKARIKAVLPTAQKAP